MNNVHMSLTKIEYFAEFNKHKCATKLIQFRRIRESQIFPFIEHHQILVGSIGTNMTMEQWIWTIFIILLN